MNAAPFVVSLLTIWAFGTLGVQAQQPPRGTLAHVSVAGALSLTCDAKCAFADAQSASVRVTIPVLDKVAPWVSYTRFGELVSCTDFCRPSGGTEIMAGLLVDLPGERSSRALHPYAAVGAGRLTSPRLYGRSWIATHAGVGLDWRLLPMVAPGVELAWERYPIHGTMAMLAVRARVSVPR